MGTSISRGLHFQVQCHDQSTRPRSIDDTAARQVFVAPALVYNPRTTGKPATRSAERRTSNTGLFLCQYLVVSFTYACLWGLGPSFERGNRRKYPGSCIDISWHLPSGSCETSSAVFGLATELGHRSIHLDKSREKRYGVNRNLE